MHPVLKSCIPPLSTWNPDPMKNTFNILLLGLCLALLSGNGAKAQNLENYQWLSAGVSQNIGEYRWSFEQNLRLRYGLSIVDKHFSEIGLRRKINKRLTIGGNYRLGWNDPATRPELFHRVNIDARIKYKWKKQDLELLWRPRIQARFKPGGEGNSAKTVLRNKVTLQKKINKKFDAWIAIELFTDLNPESRSGWNNHEFRSYAGLDIDMGKRKVLSVYYLWSEEFNLNAPERAHVIGVNYKFKLKKVKL